MFPPTLILILHTRLFLTFGNAKPEAAQCAHVAELLSRYHFQRAISGSNRVYFNLNQANTLVVHVKVWYGKGESKCFFGRGGGGYWESLLYKSSTCFFSIPQHFSTSTLVGENTNRKRVLKYTTTYITYDDVSWEFSRRELKWHHMCLAQEGKFEIKNPD